MHESLSAALGVDSQKSSGRQVAPDNRLERPEDGSLSPAAGDATAQSWVFIGRTDVEAETPIVWPHNEKS